MSLDQKFIPIRTAIYEISENFFKKLAGLFGYPENPGMPTIYISEKLDESYARLEFFESLPTHETHWPPIQTPETWFEMIFGPTPKLETIPRYIYESKEEGFYNFYVENYENLYFLPNWLSEFIQVKLNICLDISFLETIREVLFIAAMVYSQLVVFRIGLHWFLSINPFTFPWYYLIAVVDWSEDLFLGIIPSVLGVNVTASVVVGLIGAGADGLNNLVFTMPFLPMEAEETKLFINGETRDVLVFHYLPILWYRYPIPNNIREYWYYERPEILEYMQRAYHNLNIQFLPDGISMVQKLNVEVEPMASLLEKITTETGFMGVIVLLIKSIIPRNLFSWISF